MSKNGKNTSKRAGRAYGRIDAKMDGEVGSGSRKREASSGGVANWNVTTKK